MNKKIMAFITLMAGLSFLTSCTHEELELSEEIMNVVVAAEDFSVSTRSVLPETAAFENMITDVTLLAYDNDSGCLIGSLYSSSSELAISLPKEKNYRIVVFANMGDQTGNASSRMSDLESFRYTVLNYSQLKGLGIPMVCDMVTPWKSSLTVSLRRLMAKLVVKVDKSDISTMGGGGETSFSNSHISVSRIARTLHPLATGGSRALSEEELFQGEDIEYDTFSSTTADISNELVLYVPENRQGNLLPDNGNAMDKSESNTGLAGEELCTYIIHKGHKNGSTDGVSGNIVYKFFPGADNLGSFDLEGGKRYDITLRLTWNGMYTEGNWKVKKSDWIDSREISVSLFRDRAYSGSCSVALAQGSTDVPVYIYYSPSGLDYEPEGSGKPHHFSKGWGFLTQTSPGCADTALTDLQPGNGVLSGTYMSTGFVEHGAFRTRHYITIPKSTVAGYSNKIMYTTNDRSRTATLALTVAQPQIIFSPASMVFGFNEYGYDTRRTIQVSSGSPVRPCNIDVHTDDTGLITLGAFDKETGSVYVYWNSSNTGSAVKAARVTLYSDVCGVSATCTLTQQSKGGFVIEDEENGGDGDIDY